MTDPAGSDIHSSSDSIRDYKALWNQRKNTVQPKLVFNVVRAVTMWDFPYIIMLAIGNIAKKKEKKEKKMVPVVSVRTYLLFIISFLCLLLQWFVSFFTFYLTLTAAFLLLCNCPHHPQSFPLASHHSINSPCIYSPLKPCYRFTLSPSVLSSAYLSTLSSIYCCALWIWHRGYVNHVGAERRWVAVKKGQSH